MLEPGPPKGIAITGGGGGASEYNHVMSLGSPGTLAKARRLQLANASFRDNPYTLAKMKLAFAEVHFKLLQYRNYPQNPR